MPCHGASLVICAKVKNWTTLKFTYGGTLFFLPSLYFISKCKDAIPSWPVLNFEMFVSSFTPSLLLALPSILFNTDHIVTFYQILDESTSKILNASAKHWLSIG